jgi:hypothetical protein
VTWADKLLFEIESVSNSSSPLYFAHEIKTLTSFASRILNQIDESVNIKIFEEFTDRTVQIFGTVLTNIEAWGEMNGVRLSALVRYLNLIV